MGFEASGPYFEKQKSMIAAYKAAHKDDKQFNPAHVPDGFKKEPSKGKGKKGGKR